jgi:UDP-N-acetyl-D-glucosamine dehydrogenase
VLVAVLGQGYVGLPLSIAMASGGHEVHAVDVDAVRHRSLVDCRSYIVDVTDADLLRETAAGRFKPAATLAEVPAADAYVVAVPTPLDTEQVPDLSHLDAAITAIAGHAQRGALVMVESTIYPGAMRDHVAPLFHRLSGLEPGQDVYLGYSPDRVDPGRGWKLEEIPKLVAGLDEESDAVAAKLYESVFEQVVRVPSCEVAEFAKLLENTFRYLNIAFANELCRASRALDISFRDVVSAASSKPFGFMAFHPGPGVGGHCLPNNVHYLNHALAKAGQPSLLLDHAARINEAMPRYSVERLADSLARKGKSVIGSTVLLLGLAFKSGVSDARNSPTLRVAELLAAAGARVKVTDPWVERFPATPTFDLVKLCRAEVAAADAVVLMTDHDQIDYDAVLAAADVVLDCRGKLRHAEVEQL